MHARVKAKLLDLVRRIPAGQVATHKQLAAELRAAPTLIPPLLLHLSDAERAITPWWRVVADGGAVGRHPYREAQVAALRAEGHLVAPAGIVQRLNERCVTSFAEPHVPLAGSGHAPPQVNDSSQGNLATPSRARGSKGRPSSTL